VRGRGDVAVAAINGGICSESLHQRDLILARDAGEHRAPRSLANWIASVPTPPAAPWMSSVSPDFRCSASSTPWMAVSAVVPMAPAWVSVSPCGTCPTRSAGTATYSA
jgi:hypothetical protein